VWGAIAVTKLIVLASVCCLAALAIALALAACHEQQQAIDPLIGKTVVAFGPVCPKDDTNGYPYWVHFEKSDTFGGCPINEGTRVHVTFVDRERFCPTLTDSGCGDACGATVDGKEVCFEIRKSFKVNQ
jgi:hypothetical protein